MASAMKIIYKNFLLVFIAIIITISSSVQSALQIQSRRRRTILIAGVLTYCAGAVNPTPIAAFDTMAAMKASPSSKNLRILLNGGDNMLGRAVQLSFPVQAPGEEHIKDSCRALHYLDLCMHLSGHPDGDPSLDEIRKLNKKGNYLWKDYRQLKIEPPPDLRIMNIESHITHSIDNLDVPIWKGIRYHTHVDNLDAMIRPYAETTHGGLNASPVVLSLANNHVMDYGRKAFELETIPGLKDIEARIPSVSTVGCGKNWKDASKPARFRCGDKYVEVFAVSSECSGTPSTWWANEERSGVIGVPGLTDRHAVDQAVKITKRAIKAHPSTSDCVRILSVHMGPNWALKGEDEEDIAFRREYAHQVIDCCGVDMIYGHSSHHVRGIEVYKGKLILYGTGDIINDYEGFENPGEEKYNRLGGIYIADIEPSSGNLVQLQIVPMFMNRLRLERYREGSKTWSAKRQSLVDDANKGKDMSAFINALSKIDAGSKKSALKVAYIDEDKSSIPGGPVLASKVYASS